MKLNFTGDIGIFKRYEELGIDPLKLVWLPDSDFNIGNFEFIIPGDRDKFFYDVEDKYSCSFNYLKGLDLTRFRLLGFANNHCLDYGLHGALDTINHLKNRGVNIFGFSENESFSLGKIEFQGIKAGIIGCVKHGRWSRKIHGYGPDPYDTEQIIELIRKNRTEFDHIFVFPHWGTELIDIPDPHDVVNARLFVDEGASAVIGHHPHVPQGIEEYKSGIIAYSLGSFIYVHEDELGYSPDNDNRHISICLSLDIDKTSIKAYKAYYYRYNNNSKIPELLNDRQTEKYSAFLDANIENHELYRQKIKSILFKRELLSFKMRLLKWPARTVLNYARYIISKAAGKIMRK